MNQLRRLPAFVCMILISSSAKSQVYQHLEAKAKIDGQQAYILPKAAIAMEISVVTTTLTKGSEAPAHTFTVAELKVLKQKYGVDPKKYTDLLSKSPITKYTVAEDSIKLSVIAVPDYTKIFYVSSKSKWNKNQAVTFNYGADGILSDGESNYEDKTVDILLKGVSVLASVAGAFRSGGSGESNPLVPPPATDIDELDKILMQYKTLPANNFDVYKDLKSNLDKRYAAAFSEIFYSEKKEIKITHAVYTPVSATALDADIPLFKLGNDGTLFFAKTLEDQLWVKEKIAFGDVTKGYVLKLSKLKDQQVDHYQDRSDEATGFAYNIPAKVEIKLVNDDKEVIYKEVQKLPQFGIIGYARSRKQKITFTLDPVTGELKKLSIEGKKAITTDQAGAASTAATDLIKTVKGDSDDTKLENEVKRLENEKKKRDLLKELNENP